MDLFTVTVGFVAALILAGIYMDKDDEMDANARPIRPILAVITLSVGSVLAIAFYYGVI
jgi:hypothetical protein